MQPSTGVREEVRTRNYRAPFEAGRNRNRIMVNIGQDNVPLSKAAAMFLYNLYSTIDVKSGNTFTVYVDAKPYALDKPRLRAFQTSLENIALSSISLVSIDDDVVTAIGDETITVAAATSVTAFLAAVEDEYGMTLDIKVYADDEGALGAEKTGVDVIVAGDFVVVTAENEVNKKTYVVEIAA
jgi:hypothetical protein